MIWHSSNFKINCVTAYNAPTRHLAIIKNSENRFSLKMYPVLVLVIKWTIKTAYIEIYLHTVHIKDNCRSCKAWKMSFMMTIKELLED